MTILDELQAWTVVSTSTRYVTFYGYCGPRSWSVRLGDTYNSAYGDGFSYEEALCKALQDWAKKYGRDW